jgi:hypothetical protein
MPEPSLTREQTGKLGIICVNFLQKLQLYHTNLANQALRKT